MATFSAMPKSGPIHSKLEGKGIIQEPGVALAMASSSAVNRPGRDNYLEFLSHPDTPKIKSFPQNTKIWYNAWGEASRPLSLIELSHIGRNNSSSGVIMIEGIDERTFSLVAEAIPD